MIEAVEDFNNPQYKIGKEKDGDYFIGYDDHGGNISSKIAYGYKTIFAHYDAFDKRDDNPKTITE